MNRATRGRACGTRGLRGLAAACRIALGIAWAAGAAAGAADWIAPLAPPLRLTATLGERRSGHLHSGIDLSTGGAIGMPVRAVAAGSIVRLRANAFGYGRALYLQTDTGLLAVYGHLSRFSPALESELRRAQQSSGEYETDLGFEPGRFTCAPGETLAWSGATGVGPPHLHFELRRGERACNPLRLGVDAPDLAAPIVGGIALRALGERGWVDEALGPERADSTRVPVRVFGPVGVECVVIDRSGTTDARLAPHVIRLYLDGELRFARAFDQADLGQGGDDARIYGRLFSEAGPWSYRLYRWPPGAAPDISDTDEGDGVIDFARVAPGLHTLCVEAADACGRKTEREIVVDAVAPLEIVDWRSAPDGAGGWLLGLCVAAEPDSGRGPLRGSIAGSGEPSGAALPGRAFEWVPLGAGWSVARLPADASVRAADALGRPLMPAIGVGPPRPGAGWAGTVRARVEEALLVVELLPDRPLAGLPRAQLVEEGGGLVPMTPHGVGPGGGWLFVLGIGRWSGRSDRIRIFGPDLDQAWEVTVSELVACRPAEGAADWTLGPLTLQPAPGTFPGAACLLVRVDGFPDSSAWAAGGSERAADLARGGTGELTAVSPLCRIEPEWWPLDLPLGVFLAPGAVRLPAGDGVSAWGLYRRRAAGGWSWVGRETGPQGYGARVSAPGTFAIMVDRRAPEILDPLPADGEQRAEAPAQVSAAVREEGAGIDPLLADILLDGRPLIAVYDPDEGRLSAEVPAGVPPGEHGWEVRVTDRAGNTRARTFRIAWQAR
jgi:hypothetical protein